MPPVCEDEGCPHYGMLHLHLPDEKPVPPKEERTLRDEFAMAALTGLFLSDEMARAAVNPGGTRTTAKEFSIAAYAAADAMMEARKK